MAPESSRHYEFAELPVLTGMFLHSDSEIVDVAELYGEEAKEQEVGHDQRPL